MAPATPLFMFSLAVPMNLPWPGSSRATEMRVMASTQSAAHLPSAFSISDSSPARGPRFVEGGPFPLAGVSAAWRKLMMQAEMAAPHLQVAAIEGEHGVGKQTLARYIFSRSPLRSTSFQRRDAREWLATDGDPAGLTGFTYLDRVDLLAAAGQSLLLRVLKALQDHPSGRPVVLVSSQTGLRQMAAQGLLLPDLSFRLTALRFAVPPLRQRREDIAPLAQFLLDRLCQRYQQRPVSLGPGTLARLLQHSWPGNVRELANVLEAALLEASNGVIGPADIQLPDPREIAFAAPPEATALTAHGDLSLDQVIRHHVQYVLDLNRGNKLRAARQLQISRSTLYRILGNESLLAQ